MNGEENRERLELDVLKLCNKHKPYNCPEKGDGPLGKRPRGRDGTGGKEEEELVKRLQKMLKQLGYDIGASGPNKDGIDGIYGSKTGEAVIEFQRDKRYNRDWKGEKLDDDGLVGPRTADALNRAMVGRWYDKYETPKELAKDIFHITATKDALKNVSIDAKNVNKVRVVLASSIIQQVLLKDEDASQSIMIPINSEEFVHNYVDNNIVSADYWSTAFATQDKRYRDFWINYKDGRQLKFNLDDIPARYALVQKTGTRTVRIAIKPQIYVKRNGFIYPEFYGEGSTPRLIDIATTITFNHRQREKFLEVANLTFTFAVILSAYAAPPEMPKHPGGVKPTFRLPYVRSGIRRVSWQDLAEWEQIELAGTGGRVSRSMREGGHVLEHHVYIEDAALQTRALKTTEKVATKFTDADTAVSTINRVIQKNASQLKSFIGKLKPGEAEYIELSGTMENSVGYGYRVLPDGSVQRIENLRNVTVWVQADGVGGWLVRTAWPGP